MVEDTWRVVHTDGRGGTATAASHESRVGALAHALVLDAQSRRSGAHRVEGPAEPAVRTNRDLYLHLLRIGREARDASWSLSAFLRALLRASGPLRYRTALGGDDVAALFTAVTSVSPAPFDPAWSAADLSLPHAGPTDHADWERVLLSQVADLEDLVTASAPAPVPSTGSAPGPDPARRAPRPPGSGRRATPDQWRNFDPASYLECAVAGALGGWSVSDGARVPLPGFDPASPVRALTPLTWTDLSRLLACGQLFA